jgi:hypothetical protein
MEVTKAELNEFTFLLGECLRYCQQVEHDVQMILALLQEGDKHSNLNNIKDNRLTLGNAIHEIGEIDKESDRPFFSQNDYKVLYTITGERNHFVHQSFNEFLYRQGEDAKTHFEKEKERLLRFHTNMKAVSEAACKARLIAAKKVYGK